LVVSITFQAELGDLLPDYEEEAPKNSKPASASTLSPRPPAPSSSGGGLVKILEERIEMYQKAENTAKQGGELVRARR